MSDGERCEAEDITNPANELKLDQLNRSVSEEGKIYPRRLEEEAARILVLHPGSLSEKIECHLRQEVLPLRASLENVLPYEALSYVWGDEQDPRFITLCGYRFAITRNLEEALKQLRLPSSNRMLWVDAICINQCDVEEREAQVKSMHWIYKLAKRVIAWLGPSDDASRLVYSTMALIQNQNATPLSAPSAIQIGNESDPFQELLDRPYWSRAWIVQEMMFARSLVIQCGSDEVPYSALEKVFPPDTLANIQIGRNGNESMRTHFRGDPEVRIMRLDSKQMSPKRFLNCFLDRRCRERHDNIFAFLNLFSDDIRQKIPVSYSKDLPELVRHTARVIIESTQSLDIIVIRGRQKPPCAQGDDKWQLDLPSWCPYLATPYECLSIEPQKKLHLFEKKAIVSFLTNGSLQVRGFIIGRILQTISRNIQPEAGATVGWNQADIDRERKHYWRCLFLGLKSTRKDDDTLLKSIKGTTHTLFAGQGEGISDIQTLIERRSENRQGPEENALRQIWNNGNSRLVCSFRLTRAANRALTSSNGRSAAWVNCIALVPRTVRMGDTICMIRGCSMPVVLRRMETDYRVLGEAYVDTRAIGQLKVAIRLRDFILE